jgi:hypothetical protein
MKQNFCLAPIENYGSNTQGIKYKQRNKYVRMQLHAAT